MAQDNHIGRIEYHPSSRCWENPAAERPETAVTVTPFLTLTPVEAPCQATAESTQMFQLVGFY